MNEKELIQYVKNLNVEIEFRNIGKPPQEREEFYDIKKVLQGFHKIQQKEEKKEFRDKHDCKYCLYFENPRRCEAIGSCPLIDGEKFEELSKPYKCSLDVDGSCPYGRTLEVCIGFCLNNIVKKHQEKWSVRYESKARRNNTGV